MQNGQVIDIAAAQAAANPEKLPSFPSVAGAVDRWVVAIGSIFAYRYIMTRKKG